MSNKRLLAALIMTVSAISFDSGFSPASAKKQYAPGEEFQIMLKKASRAMKSGNAPHAMPTLQKTLDAASSSTECMALAEQSTPFGMPFMSFRRQCMQKALTMAKTPDDYIEVAHACRKYEVYDVERSAIDGVLKSASNPTDLYALAKRAHQMAARDVVSQTLDKAYTLCKSVPDALHFAQQAQLVSADELARKAIRDLVDDEGNTIQLLALLDKIEPFQMKDMNRYLLKKCLDVSSTFDDYVAIANAARRYDETDIRSVAVYRAKKKRILNQIEEDRAKAPPPAAPVAPVVPETPRPGF